MNESDERQPASSGVVSSAAVPPLADEGLVMQALPLIASVAQSLYRQLGGKMQVDDLRSIGHFAVTGLVRAYDPERAPFVPYMRQRLRWAMLDGIRRQTHGRAMAARARALADSMSFAAARAEQRDGETKDATMPPSEATFQQRFQRILREHATVMGIRMVAEKGGHSAVTPSSVNPERATLTRAAMVTLRSAVASIEDERLRSIVERHYFHAESLASIARSLGVSKPWVSRLHAQAISLLEKRLRAAGVSSRR